MKSLSRVRLLATLWTTAYQALPSVGFSREEYWSGVPLPSPLLFRHSHLRGHPKSGYWLPGFPLPPPWPPWRDLDSKLLVLTLHGCQRQNTRAQGRGCPSAAFTLLFHFHQEAFEFLFTFCPEKAMAPHSSTLAWEIPWVEEPGRFQSMG